MRKFLSSLIILFTCVVLFPNSAISYFDVPNNTKEILSIAIAMYGHDCSRGVNWAGYIYSIEGYPVFVAECSSVGEMNSKIKTYYMVEFDTDQRLILITQKGKFTIK